MEIAENPPGVLLSIIAESLKWRDAFLRIG
jgi:hypothetical protein